jgi:uncharacterized membrane protein
MQKQSKQILQGVKVICTILILLILIQTIFAVKVSGAIYDHSLTPIQKVVISINTTPEQKMVSKYGGYHFIIEPGTYTIKATLTQNGVTKLIAEEKITITTKNPDAEIIRDLFMFSDFNMAAEFKQPWYAKPMSFFRSPIPYITIIILILGLLFIHQKNKTKQKVKSEQQNNNSLKNTTNASDIESMATNNQVESNLNEETTQSKKHNSQFEQTNQTAVQFKEQPQLVKPLTNDEKLKKHIIQILSEKQQTTQKYIRQQFPLSEAKISLILKELESDNIIQREKQGRSNILTLTKKEQSTPTDSKN